MSTLNVTNIAGPSNTGTAATLSSINGGPISGARNRIINGDMRIDQRNGGAAVTPADGAYTLDRWRAGASAASKFSVQQSAVAPAGFTNSMLVTSLSAFSVSTGDNFEMFQYVEGFNVADLGWGTADAQTITVSFRVRSSLTGTFGGAINNSAFNRSYPFSYTISAANTWETKAIAIPGDTSGTWLTNSGIGLILCICLGAGSSRSGTAGAWAAGWAASATGATSVVGTNGATFYITGVQLEAGTVATPFERRSYGQELSLCQRYCTSLANGNTCSIGIGQAFSSSVAGATVRFPVTMRAAPTLVVSSGGHFGATTSVGAANNFTTSAPSFFTPNSFFCEFSGGSGLAAGSATHITSTNASASLLVTAEL